MYVAANDPAFRNWEWDQSHHHHQKKRINIDNTYKIVQLEQQQQNHVLHHHPPGPPPPPPPALLVGIELNPGPPPLAKSSQVVPTSMAMNAQSMFTDGVHSILTFLENTDWLSASHTCHAWYDAAASTPSGQLREFDIQVTSYLLLEPASRSPLRRQISEIFVGTTKSTQSNADKRVHADLIQSSIQLLCSFTSLTRLDLSDVPLTLDLTPMHDLPSLARLFFYHYALDVLVAVEERDDKSNIDNHADDDDDDGEDDEDKNEGELLFKGTSEYHSQVTQVDALLHQAVSVSRIPSLVEFFLIYPERRVASPAIRAWLQLIVDHQTKSGVTMFPLIHDFSVNEQVMVHGDLALLVAVFPALKFFRLILTERREEIELIIHFTRLQTVWIEDIERKYDDDTRMLNERYPTLLPSLIQCHSLTHITFWDSTFSSRDEWTLIWQNLTHLTSLKFHSTNEPELLSNMIPLSRSSSTTSPSPTLRLCKLELHGTCLSSLVALAHFIGLEELHMEYWSSNSVSPVEGVDFDQLKTMLDDSLLLPQLQRLLIVANDAEDRRFKYDRVKKINVEQYRLYPKQKENIAETTFNTITQTTPPAIPLVGIELNPGPTSLVTSMAAHSLFIDGLHSIFAFLSTQDWLIAIRCCHSWYATFLSTPNRRLTRASLGVTGLLNRIEQRLYLTAIPQHNLIEWQRRILIKWNLLLPGPPTSTTTTIIPTVTSSLLIDPNAIGCTTTAAAFSSFSSFSSPILRHIIDIQLSFEDPTLTLLYVILLKLPSLESIDLTLLRVHNTDEDDQLWKRLEKEGENIFGRAHTTLQRIQCTLSPRHEEFIRHLSRCSHLTEITVVNLPLTLTIDSLLNLPSLTTMNLQEYATGEIQSHHSPPDNKRSTKLKQQFTSHMRVLARIPTLTHLVINKTNRIILRLFIDEVTKGEFNFPFLHSFAFGSRVFPDGTLTKIQPLIPNLRSLEILEMRITEIKVYSLFTFLQSITLRSKPAGGDPINDVVRMAMASVISRIPHLTHLEMTNWCLDTSEQWRDIFLGCSHLTSLSLINTGQSDLLQVLSEPMTHACARIQILSLNETSLWYLSQLHHFTQLHTLLLKRNAFYDSSAIVYKAMDDSSFIPSLKRLELKWTDFSQITSILIWDKEKRIGLDSYRVDKRKIAMKSVVEPPTARRLVGIELNPGPASFISSGQNLFTDGLHSIFAFLSNKDWINSSYTCHAWCRAAASMPSRKLELHNDERLNLLKDAIEEVASSSSSSSSTVSSSSTSLLRHLHTVGLEDVSVSIFYSWLIRLHQWTSVGKLRAAPQLKQHQRTTIVSEYDEMLTYECALAIHGMTPLLQDLDIDTYYMCEDNEYIEIRHLITQLNGKSSFFSQLRKLSFSYLPLCCDITPITTLPELHTLQLVNYTDIENSEDDSFHQMLIDQLRLFSHCPQLTHLDLGSGSMGRILPILCDYYTRDDDITPDQCISFPRLISFECYIWGDDELPDHALSTLFRVFPTTNIIYLESISMVNFHEILKFPSVITLATPKVVVATRNEPEQLLSILMKCSSLTRIHFQGHAFTSVHQWSRFFSVLPQLTKLQFRHITDIILDTLTEAKDLDGKTRCVSRIVDLTMGEMLDFSPSRLSLLRHFTSCRKLWINSPYLPPKDRIDYANVYSFMNDLTVMPHLETFYLALWGHKKSKQEKIHFSITSPNAYPDFRSTSNNNIPCQH